MVDQEKKKLAQGQEQVNREEESRKRRIVMRRQEEEKRRRAERRRRNIRNAYLAILWLGVIGGGFILVAWNWTIIGGWMSRLGL